MKTYFARNMTIASLPLVAAAALTALRLCGVIAWGWCWVLSPLWITGALIYLASMLLVIIAWARENR